MPEKTTWAESCEEAVRMSLSAQLGLTLYVSHVTLGKSLLSRPQLPNYNMGRDTITAL